MDTLISNADKNDTNFFVASWLFYMSENIISTKSKSKKCFRWNYSTWGVLGSLMTYKYNILKKKLESHLMCLMKKLQLVKLLLKDSGPKSKRKSKMKNKQAEKIFWGAERVKLMKSHWFCQWFWFNLLE